MTAIKRLLLIVVPLSLGVVAVVWWRTTPPHGEVAAAAQAFVEAAQAGRVEEAYGLTLQGHSLLGANLAEFTRYSASQRCAEGGWQVLSVSPEQSRGNRLRRLLTGRELEMPSIGVRFDLPPNPCPISVELRQDAEGRWRVFNYQRTAG